MYYQHIASYFSIYTEFPLKECGKLTYRIYLAHPQILDAWVYQNVTSQSFHLVLYNHEGGRTTVKESSHSLQPFCNRSDFNLFIYRGRTTEGNYDNMLSYRVYS